MPDESFHKLEKTTHKSVRLDGATYEDIAQMAAHEYISIAEMVRRLVAKEKHRQTQLAESIIKRE